MEPVAVSNEIVWARAQQILNDPQNIKSYTAKDQNREVIFLRTSERNVDRAIAHALALAARGELAYIDLIRLPTRSNGHPSAPHIEPDPI